jgi:electron transport complex protein RnfA
MELLSLFIASVLVSNIVLVRFLGICPFLGVSKNTNNAVGMGLAATFVVFFSSLLSFGLYHLVLKPLGLEYLALLSFILIIAAFVQFVEMFFKKYIPALYKALGIYLPLITTNCIVLGVALDNIENGFTFWEMLIYSISVPVGFTLVLVLFSIIRERLDVLNKVPGPFKGTAIALITTALLALAFTGFAGLI